MSIQFSKETFQKIVEQLEGAVVTAIPGALNNTTKPEDPHTQCKDRQVVIWVYI